MPDDATDFSTPPPGLDVPSSLTAESQDTTIQMQNFVFCILYAGKSYVTLPVSAPDHDLALLTISQFVAQMNQTIIGMGFPPNFTFVEGPCI